MGCCVPGSLSRAILKFAIADVAQPDKFVGISSETLATHSEWGASWLKYEQKSEAILPVKTSPHALKKMVKAWYSGYIDIGEDAEEMLVLANALQIKLIETACTEYLLALKLTSEQLGQMLQLFQMLSLKASLQELARRYTQLPWTTQVMAELQVIFNYFHKFELLHLMLPQLKFQACGKLCELQVIV